MPAVEEQEGNRTQAAVVEVGSLVQGPVAEGGHLTQGLSAAVDSRMRVPAAALEADSPTREMAASRRTSATGLAPTPWARRMLRRKYRYRNSRRTASLEQCPTALESSR